MLELLYQFEKVAVRFDALTLVIPGIICVAAGLLLWLGGLGHRISLALISGAAAGGICGLLISGRNIVISAIAACAGAAAALFASRIFTALLAGILGTTLSFAFLIGPYLGHAESFRYTYRTADEGQRLDFAETAEAAKAFGNYAVDAVKKGAREMAPYKRFIPPVVGLMLLVAGFLAKRMTWALCCSIIGTAMIFSGMILLLLYKGSSPVSSIAENRPFYRAAVIAMAAVGALVQLTLSRYEYGKRRRIAKKPDVDEKPASATN